MRDASPIQPIQTAPTPVSDSARIRRRLAENNDAFWAFVILALNVATVTLLLMHARKGFERYRLAREIETISVMERQLELELDRLRVERAWRRENADPHAEAARFGMEPTPPARIFRVTAGGAP